MKPVLVRKYRRKHKVFPGIELKRNPELLLGVSLPFLIATSISLKSAVAMIGEMLAINMVTVIVSFFTSRFCPKWLRVVINVGAATVIMMLTRALITMLMPDISNYLGTYIYLMAMNGLIFLLSESKQMRHPVTDEISLWKTAKSALIHTGIFAGAMLIISALRELFGSGTLWGHAIQLPFRMQGIILPFFGFISVGFLLAISKWIMKKFTYIATVEAVRREARDKARYANLN